MIRDWDLIREVLTEVEAVPPDQRDSFRFTDATASRAKIEHALLLVDAGYIEGTPYRPLSDPPALLRPALTWQGHELLDTIRSQALWERIKKTAAEKGLALTFESVKVLAVVALKSLVGS